MPDAPAPVTAKTAGLILGPALFLVLLVLPVEGLPWQARAVAAGTAWIICWWVTEAIPVAATALLPIVLFPALGAMGAGTVTAEYGDPIIFLFIGGFFIAIAMEKWNLHARIALTIVERIGTSQRRIVAGFIAATGFVSAWISNTATAMMMTPVAAAVIARSEGKGVNGRFSAALTLSIAYAASIGGIATLIGSPPNLIFAGMYRTLTGSEITFMQWAKIGFPLAVILLALCWAYLVYVAFPLTSQAIRISVGEEVSSLGPISREERRVLSVFLLVATLWITRAAWGGYLPMISDPVIAVFGAVLLFLLPAGNGGALLQWNDAGKIPWNVVLLFGGGLALAKGFVDSGLEAWVAGHLRSIAGVPPFIVILAVIILVIFMTEIASNTATATLFVPIAGMLASVISMDPLLLMVPAALSASLAFMMPVGTPPNAIIYATGRVTMAQMIRAGFWMNCISIAVLAVGIPVLI